MTLRRPCINCGEPSASTRCSDCASSVPRRPQARTHDRGYGASWQALSTRARRLQPWCEDCRTTVDLTADHSPEAWERKAAGLVIRLRDIDVVCRSCNSKRGAARTSKRGAAPTSRGEGARRGNDDPFGKEKSPLQLGTILSSNRQPGDDSAPDVPGEHTSDAPDIRNTESGTSDIAALVAGDVKNTESGTSHIRDQVTGDVKSSESGLSDIRDLVAGDAKKFESELSGIRDRRTQ